MGGFFDANYNITKLSKDAEGNITELELNGKAVEIGAATLENNKTATIDVSTYTDPVVITPTSGKDGMKKATVTLSNIPTANINNINQEVPVISCLDENESTELLLPVDVDGNILSLADVEDAVMILVLTSGHGTYRRCYRTDDSTEWIPDTTKYSTELVYVDSQTFALDGTTLTIGTTVYTSCEDTTISLALASTIATSS